MKMFTIDTIRRKLVVDITDTINNELKKMQADEGICTIFVTHTTCALTTADLDPGTDLDMLDAFDKLIPKLEYRHPHNPHHVPDHILSSLIGTSLTIPVQNGELILGIWQRVVLIEFDGPKERTVMVSFVKE